ncbi:MAG TPA: HAD family acid phosphatase [Aquimonas sp.]|nr:HAD family acid phosphatase [Aquimonas sp.]HRF54921.1 HAD family acid phosphatase [Aquimonas sp.]
MTAFRPALLSFALLLSACASTPTALPPPAMTATAATGVHDNLNATLWMQSAAEYQAATLGSYAQARQSLDAALADTAINALPVSEQSQGFESLPPAIITDADETLIDNSPFQARRIRDGGDFDPATWAAWSNERKARAIPGAVAFAQYAARRGVTVYYVTNRDHASEYQATADNLRALGFPLAEDNSNLLLRGDPRAPGKEKGERRRLVAKDHRVVLLLGDNLGDFLDGVGGDVAARENLIAPYADWWGSRWIMLPNPSYGSWESAVLKACGEQPATACKREALRYD